MDTESKATKFQIGIILIIFFQEAFNLAVLFPIIPYMVSEFLGSDNDEYVSIYAGILTSAFSFFQMIAIFPLGRLSDKIGRKRVLILGMTGNFVG